MLWAQSALTTAHRLTKAQLSAEPSSVRGIPPDFHLRMAELFRGRRALPYLLTTAELPTIKCKSKSGGRAHLLQRAHEANPRVAKDEAPCLRKGFQFGQDGGEIFRNRRMNMHCALYYGIRWRRIHDVQQNMDHFIASSPKNRSAQNLFCFRINRDFDEPLGLTFLNGTAHPAHRIHRGEGGAPRLPYFGVSDAAAAQGRINIQSVRLDSV